MATGFVHVKFDQFFDRRSVLDRMDKKEQKVLGRTGAYGRGAVRKSIRKAPKKKAITSGPPRYHVRGRESLKDRIFFGYDKTTGSVVVGPEKFNAKGGGGRGSIAYRLVGASTVPELLEKGGTRIVIGRGRGRNAKRIKPIRQTYKPRPFVGPSTPAFLATADKMAELMREIPI